MPRPLFDTVIVRFAGEIGVKAEWTRKLYERRLMTNIKAVLKENAIPRREFVRRFGRIYIKTTQTEETAEKLKKVFGISSLSPSLETSSKLSDIQTSAINLASSKFKKGKTFGVRCRRVGKHPFSSQDVCRKIGQTILDRLPELKLRVDLTHPEQNLHVEIRDDKAYMFTDIVRGASGLPLGTQPKLINLFKGNAASAVACWLTMKRGCPPILVHFESIQPQKKEGINEVIETAGKLMKWATGFPRNLYLIKPFQRLNRISQNHSAEQGDLLYKRLMLQIALRLAKMKNAEGIVTGDTIDEPIKATLHVFRMLDETVKGFPVYRPLIGMDSFEIQELASVIVLDKTATDKTTIEYRKAKSAEEETELDDVRKIEKKFDSNGIAEEALKSLRVLRI